jgi:hypothetical protein
MFLRKDGRDVSSSSIPCRISARLSCVPASAQYIESWPRHHHREIQHLNATTRQTTCERRWEREAWPGRPSSSSHLAVLAEHAPLFVRDARTAPRGSAAGVAILRLVSFALGLAAGRAACWVCSEALQRMPWTAERTERRGLSPARRAESLWRPGWARALLACGAQQTNQSERQTLAPSLRAASARVW